MPSQETNFSPQWLNQTDGNQHTISWWCRADAKDIHAGFCILCYKKVPCGNMGLIQLLQHATGKRHKEIACTRFSKSSCYIAVQSKISEESASSSKQGGGLKSKSVTNYVVTKSHNDQVTTAEVLWALKLVENDMPFSSCNNIAALLNLVFPTDAVVKDFTCGATKATYNVRHGIAPYFKQLMLEDVRKSPCVV